MFIGSPEGLIQTPGAYTESPDSVSYRRGAGLLIVAIAGALAIRRLVAHPTTFGRGLGSHSLAVTPAALILFAITRVFVCVLLLTVHRPD